MKKSIVLLAACLLFTACENSEVTPAESTVNNTISTVEENATAAESEEPAVNENPDFRNVSWGMSVDEVKKYEDATLTSDYFNEGYNEYILSYDGISVMNHPTKLNYFFENGKLSTAEYMLDVTENEDYEINNEFFDIADGITAKYGDPEKEALIIYCGKGFYSNRVIFLETDNFSFDTSEYCKVNDFENASPVYSITWKTDNTEIWLNMHVSRNDDGIYIAPDKYEITYRAIDVDNAL